MHYQKLKNKPTIVVQESTQFEYGLPSLPAGFYEVSNVGNMFQSILGFDRIKEREKLLKFSKGVLTELVKEVDNFLDPTTVNGYKELGVCHKVGYIVYGSHGTGKTALCTVAINQLIEKYEAICINCTSLQLDFVKKVVSQIRNYQDNPIVLFFDECDSNFNYEENAYLTFLDGTDSVENLIFLGCTNHINKIPERIKNRKSRIKKCFEIKSLPYQVYEEYLHTKLPNIDKTVGAALCYKSMDNSLTIDEFKNAIIDYKIHNSSINDAIKNAKETYSSHLNEDDES